MEIFILYFLFFFERNKYYFCINYGNIDETTITSTTVNNDSIIDPLLVGDVWVVKCHDGFAKFKVLSVNGVAWEATVKYVYTSGNSFSN